MTSTSETVVLPPGSVSVRRQTTSGMIAMALGIVALITVASMPW